jgi:uncharacterized membrane protein
MPPAGGGGTRRRVRNVSRLSVVGSLPVPASPEEAWDAWSRLEDWPRWDWMGSASARWLEGEPWAVGARLLVGHRPFAFECRLVESRPPETVTWASRGAGIDTLHTYRFLPHPRGCLVEMSETFDGRGARLLLPLVRSFWGYQLRAFRRHVR